LPRAPVDRVKSGSRESAGQDLAFANEQTLVRTIGFVVSLTVGGQEVLIRDLGIPEVQGEVDVRAGGIGVKSGTPEVRIALEELYPGTIAPIGTFKAFFISWLDFELP
jgi:hypothetical protein